MLDRKRLTRIGSGALALLLAAGLVSACSGSGGDGNTSASTSATTPAGVDQLLATNGDRVVARLDPRFQSYNIEMVEVTGGEFWKPYDAGPGKVVRPPIDLGSERLRNLARALGPAYIRVSGTWANSTYFDPNGTAGAVAPAGYRGVLTGDQWKGVGAFADAVDGRVVTSFAVNTGTRDASGVWQPDQARALLQFSKDHHVPLAAAEFYNEPSFTIGVPAGYDAADYVRDFKTFEATVDQVMPKLKIVGPGSADDVTPLILDPAIKATDILDGVGSSFKAFSYHDYPKVSERCGSKEGPEIALTEEYLSRIESDKQYYETLRDQYVPGAPMWVTETAQAACGGDRWAATYRDVIRYVDTLGRFGDGNGDAVFHNTLAASDYGLLDEDGFVPRPDYWAAVVWAKLMGPEVVAVSSARGPEDLTVYAHCTPGDEHAVTYAVVNASPSDARTVATRSGKATVYLLTGESLDGGTISLNGTALTAADDGTVPRIKGKAAAGSIGVPPASVAFVVEPVDGGPCA